MLKNNLVKHIYRLIKTDAISVEPGTFVSIHSIGVSEEGEIHRSRSGRLYAISLDTYVKGTGVYLFRNPKTANWFRSGITELKFEEGVEVKISFSGLTVGLTHQLCIVSKNNDLDVNVSWYSLTTENTFGPKLHINNRTKHSNISGVRHLEVASHGRHGAMLVVSKLVLCKYAERAIVVTNSHSISENSYTVEEPGYHPLSFCLNFNKMYVVYRRENKGFSVVKYHIASNNTSLKVSKEEEFKIDEYFPTENFDKECFGNSIAITGDGNILIGAPYAENSSGRVYSLLTDDKGMVVNSKSNFFKDKNPEPCRFGTKLFSSGPGFFQYGFVVNPYIGPQSVYKNGQNFEAGKTKFKQKENRQLNQFFENPPLEKEEVMPLVNHQDHASINVQPVALEEPSAVNQKMTIDNPNEELDEITVRLEIDLVVRLHSIATSLGMQTEELCQRVLANSDILS